MPEHPIVYIISFISGIAALFSAYASWRNIKRTQDREDKKQMISESKYMTELETQVNQDTVGLYQKLAEQYNTMTQKDKELLRKVSSVIRKLIMLERSVNDTIGELEYRWDLHSSEAEEIGCSYYGELNAYFWERISSLEKLISDTMTEVDTILLNGKEFKNE